MSAVIEGRGSVSELLSAAADKWPDSVALIETGSAATLTWAQFDRLAHGQAGRLIDAGVQPGDRVALRLPTSADFAVALFAVVRAGAIAVPLSPQAPATELLQLLEHSGARVLVEREPTDELPDGVATFTPGTEQADSFDAIGGGEDIAVISYTSGTTGPPRGVMLSHRALLANLAQLGQVRPGALDGTDRVLITIPLFHVYGLGPGLLQSVAVGATVVLAERFNAKRALADCATHRVTCIAGVPAMYAEFAGLSADELGEGLSTVRRLTSGAAPLHPQVLAAIRQATGLGVFEGYGLTECAPVVSSTLVTGIWLGNDDGESTKKVSGGNLPGEIWKAYMTVALKGQTPTLLPGANRWRIRAPAEPAVTNSTPGGLIGALLGEPQAAAPAPRAASPPARHADASRGPSQDDRNFLEKLFGVGE